jgi:ABC-type ATPase with predicted acetyltransferase domain
VAVEPANSKATRVLPDQAPETPLVWAEVTDALLQGTTKRLRLAGGGTINVHGFACVGRGDVVRRDSTGHVLVRAGDAVLPVMPAFQRELRIEVAEGLTLTLAARELVAPEEFAAYHALSQFHYRSEKSFGRRSVLLLETSDSRFPRYVGFVEVTTPFLHLSNRNRIMDAPFAQPGRSVTWSSWSMSTRMQLVNVIARVSRVVVHPELRGLGLSRPLLDAASLYALERWQVGGLRPLFLEITADMLTFMPFVSGAGLRYIGDSDGNVGRLAKDIGYLSRAQAGEGRGTHSVLSGRGKGILRRQKRDIAMVTRLRDDMSPGEDVGDFMRRLLLSEDVDNRVGELLLPLLRHPKPTYMRGLTSAAEAFLTRRTSELRLSRPIMPPPAAAPMSGSLVVEDLTLAYRIDTGELTEKAGGAIRRAFGLDRSFDFRTGIAGLSLSLSPGNVGYVYGASGSGKSTLLNLIAFSKADVNLAAGDAPDATVSGSVRLPSGAQVGRLAIPENRVPLVSAIGADNLGQAIYALNSAGLAEPRLYLTTYDKLSAGQQYRASLAKLICSGSNVWVLDEFASGLDDATGTAVGRNFAKAARQMGVILIVATVRRRPLVNAIAPEVVVHLTQLEPPVVTRDWKNWAGVSE